MILEVTGNWQTKGNPPAWAKKLPKWLWRMFWWDKKGAFERTVYFEDAHLIEIGTPLGPLAVGVTDARLVVVLNGNNTLLDASLETGALPFAWSVAGQSISGAVGIRK